MQIPLPCFWLSFYGPINLNSFGVPDVSQCHDVCHICLIPQLILLFFAFLNFLCLSVNVCHSVTHVMCVTLVVYVTHKSGGRKGGGGSKSDYRAKAFGGQLCCRPKAKINIFMGYVSISEKPRLDPLSMLQWEG
jgi:hypothetical protein